MYVVFLQGLWFPHTVQTKKRLIGKLESEDVNVWIGEPSSVYPVWMDGKTDKWITAVIQNHQVRNHHQQQSSSPSTQNLQNLHWCAAVIEFIHIPTKILELRILRFSLKI